MRKKMDWQSSWPSGWEVEAWVVASGEIACAIADPGKRMESLAFAISRLVGRGHVGPARILAQRLKETATEHPAKAPLGDIAEAYLGIGWVAEGRATFAAAMNSAPTSTDRFILRVNAVPTEFADLLPDLTPEERQKADYFDAVRQAKRAIAANDLALAREATARAERVVRDDADHWDSERILELYVAVGDRQSAIRIFDSIPEEERSVSLLGRSLLGIGLDAEVDALAEGEVRRELAYARTMDLANYHHPAGTISRVVDFLVTHGRAAMARDLLGRTLVELKDWHMEPGGWMAAAVYGHLGVGVARVDGLDAARSLLDKAAHAAVVDKTEETVTGLLAVIEAFLAVRDSDRALQLVKKLRSREDRRRYSAITLARAGRRSDLDLVLRTINDPAEASDIAWRIAANLEQVGSA